MCAAHRLTYLWRRVAAPVVIRVQRIMTSGLTPQKLAQTLCIGVAFGIVPLLWGASLVCFVLGSVFRLNHVVLQSVNYLLWPVQLALLIPFVKLGIWLFPGESAAEVNVLSTVLHHPGLSSAQMLAWVTLKAVAAWMVTALPAAVVIYGVLRVMLFRKQIQHS